MRVAAILAAGGFGTRMGGELPKQFRDLGDGRTMLARSLETIMNCELIDEVIVALPPQKELHVGDDGSHAGKTITLVRGGDRRQDSVANALASVSDDVDLIVIHDAARPFATVRLFERTIRAAREHGAAIAAMAVTDTVKQADSTSAALKRVAATLPRDTIYLAQTPQAFKRDLLERAMATGADSLATDEAMLLERAGIPVHLVAGEVGNIKVTTLEDLERARRMARGVSDLTTMRIGTGYDLHRLVPDRPLILAGVRIPFDRGLQGHSDADIVCHAVTDAVLGAAAVGDIGRLFPDTDPDWKDADSVELLRRAAERVRAAGYIVVNVDVTVIAERPKLLPHLEEMCANLAAALGIDHAGVSIKGKTNEGIGETGQGEAMACHAVALLSRL